MRTTGPCAEVVQLVTERDGHACVICGDPIHGLRGYDWVLHHRRPRAMGGTRRKGSNEAGNLLTLCPGCHERVESHRQEALWSGWLVLQSADPCHVPVLVDRERTWTYLTDDGRQSHHYDDIQEMS